MHASIRTHMYSHIYMYIYQPISHRTVVEDESSLLKEVMSAGLDEASVPELQQQLREYMSGSQTVSSDYGECDPVGLSVHIYPS
jgi:hypothetical protein